MGCALTTQAAYVLLERLGPHHEKQAFLNLSL